MTAIRSADTEEARDAKARLAEARALLTDKARLDFFDALFASALSEEVLSVRPVRLVGLAQTLHEEVARHQKGGIEVVSLDDDETGEMVLVGINDDRPFLFDSALQAALAHGARIRAAFHPVITLDGRRISVIALICNAASDTERAAMVEGMREAFAQGALAVRDWRAMLARLDEARSELAATPPFGDISENLAFLDWLAADHFTFLGARDYVLAEDGNHGRLEPVDGSGLGILSAAEARVIRRGAERPGLSAPVRAFLDEKEPLIVTKSHARSKVHRRGHMDYIGVKRFDAEGNFTGEHRFVGLFTSTAYNAQPRTIPLLRRKIAAVMDRAGLDAASHDGKALTHILDTFPRDELFQISVDELYAVATGILRLGGLPRLKLFLRFDRFDRFVSAILLAPRDHLNSKLVADIHAYLARSLNGRTSASEVATDDSPLARIHYIVGRNEGPLPPIDVQAMQQHIAGMIETWDDALATAMCAVHGTQGLKRLEALAPRFSPGYRDHFAAHEGVRDLTVLQELAAARDGLKVRARVWRRQDDASATLHLKLHVLGDVLPLSASLPVFENMGLKVISEDAFPVSFSAGPGWRQDAVILDFVMERADGIAVKVDEIRGPLEDALHAVLQGDAENDGFNRLVMGAGLAWRDVTILRAVGRYLRQAAIPFSLAYMEQALVRNAEVAALLVALFYARCMPGRDGGEGGGDATALSARIETALKDVPSLDDDRIIRRFRNVIENVLRTNFWQRDGGETTATESDGKNGGFKPYVVLKLDSGRLDELPAPRPWREIFVYSPAVEGVHLRFGPIARGGIRWSDRREDFRTEILGLVKAQQVKNAVIVPVGAKGGFFPKTMPDNPTRDEFMAVGIAAYKTLINALLDVTDNLDAHGATVPPPGVLRLDGDDPYLVVAADKGTATFSDIANAIALERGFWLGDAFASGGSNGFDHKKMGITARGAWEAVKRHFRELGTDIQKEDFTVIGVGDMSGDVFGNGMLLSEHIRLIAAFDHRHIFLDPNADAARGFAERKRLFDLPRSSWDDYSRDMIGKGGGIFARTLKEIPLGPEVKAMLEVEDDTLSPPALIHALLKAKTDLLWFGGIGTYVKASSQSNNDVGDRANDAVRVNGGEVRARVVGEGANLGVTQPGRIEYARAGGRIDTDAVDNSAGVDTSDHEVNLKILLSGPVRRGEIDEARRNSLLASMTDAVAAHVLADNYNQTLALSVAERNAVEDIDADVRFMRDLEARGRLNRSVEFLPGDAAAMTLAHDRKGLTRPELCVLLAYAKLDLDAQILASALPDDPALEELASGYFPPKAVAAFPKEPSRHRLKREIVSTVLSNRIVNLAGPAFAFRMRELSGLPGDLVARAFVMADGAFALSALKARIDMLDGQVDAGVQVQLYAGIAGHFRRVTPWFLTHIAADTPLADAIALYRAGVESLRVRLDPDEEDRARIGSLARQVPEELARDWTLLRRLTAAPDIALLAHGSHQAPDDVAALYFALGRTLGLDRLRSWSQRLTPSEHWDRLALRRLTEDLSATQRGLARKLLADGGKGASAVEAWACRNAAALERVHDFATALESSGELSIAKLMLAASQVRSLA
jgi:glutamate dehydrogenase